jgi:LemA protein
VFSINAYSVSVVHCAKGDFFMKYQMLLLSGTVVAIVVGVVLILAVFVIGIFNGLVGLRNRVKNAYAQIDVQLKRRYDLIPNLVETAKGYMKHEKETLEAVINARNQAASAASTASKDPTAPGAIQNLAGADGALTGALGKLMVVVEQYPDLKASTNMLQVQEELTSTENRVAFSRQAYNDSVLGYNNKREMFPSNIVAGMFGFKFAQSWELDDEAARDAPKVNF